MSPLLPQSDEVGDLPAQRLSLLPLPRSGTEQAREGGEVPQDQRDETAVPQGVPFNAGTCQDPSLVQVRFPAPRLAAAAAVTAAAVIALPPQPTRRSRSPFK